MTASKNKGFTLVELLVVIVIIGLLAALLLPAIAKALCSGKQGAMTATLQQLTTAAKLYESDNGMYPDSNAAFESRTLSKALTKNGPKALAYFEFKEGMLDEQGDIVSGILVGETVHYRNNQAALFKNIKDPDVHNKQTIDLWTRDCAKQEKGCNNWE